MHHKSRWSGFSLARLYIFYHSIQVNNQSQCVHADFCQVIVFLLHTAADIPWQMCCAWSVPHAFQPWHKSSLSATRVLQYCVTKQSCFCVAHSHTSGGPSQIISCKSLCVHKFLSLPPWFSSKKKRSALSFVIKNVWNWGQTAWYSALWQASESGGLLWLVVNWSLKQLLLQHWLKETKKVLQFVWSI